MNDKRTDDEIIAEIEANMSGDDEYGNVLPIKPAAAYMQEEWVASDEAVAIEFERRHGEELVYVPVWGRWLIWRGGVWDEDQTLHVHHLAGVLARDIGQAQKKKARRHKIEGHSTVAAIERRARSLPAMVRLPATFDADPMLFNTPTGTVDLTTGAMREHRRADYCSKQTAVAPDTTQGCPRWLAFLDRITGSDAELIGFLQRMCGYCLTGRISEQALFFLYGTGGNGKSTFLNVLHKLLQDYAKTAAADAFTASRYDQHAETLASLAGARLVSAIETDKDRHWKETTLKRITGGDPIRARFLFRDSFEFTPVCKLLIVANDRPHFRDVDEAIKRRLYLIPFEVKIPDHERIKDFDDQLITNEGPAILAWMIEGCLNWQTDGLRPPVRVLDATEEYFETENLKAQWLDECCDLIPTAFTLIATLYASWRNWATERGEDFDTQRAFSKNLAKIDGLKRDRHPNPNDRRHGFRGISLKPTSSRQERDDDG